MPSVTVMPSWRWKVSFFENEARIFFMGTAPVVPGASGRRPIAGSAEASQVWCGIVLRVSPWQYSSASLFEFGLASNHPWTDSPVMFRAMPECPA
jgi:hypothetical protein